jgi:hypothetical protein
MARKNDDRQWISTEIEKHVRNHLAPPRGWRKAVNWLREWGILGVVISVIVALLGITFTAIYFATGEIGRNSEFRGRTDQRLMVIENQLLSIRVLIAASTPASPRSQRQAREILTQVKNDKTVLPEQVVTQAGSNFIEAATMQPSAWDVALEFANYRSVINASFASPILKLPELLEGIPAGYELAPPGRHLRVGLFGKVGPGEMPAISDRIDQAVTYRPGIGPKYLRFTGFGENAPIELDGLRLRNVILRDVTIKYRGGPVQLDNVIFISCRFELDREPRGFQLAETLVASFSTSFHASA